LRASANQQADRADDTRGDRAGGHEFEDQAVDASHQENERDVGIGDDGQESGDPSGIDGFDEGILRRQALRLATSNLHHATIDLLEQFGRIARDEVDDICLQRAVGSEGRNLTDRLLSPVGIAATQFGEAADEGDGIIRRLCRHGFLRLGLAVAILLVFAFLVRGAARQTWYRTTDLHRRCSADVGAWRHSDMGRIENVGAGARTCCAPEGAT
jgi:hypothetical protein